MVSAFEDLLHRTVDRVSKRAIEQSRNWLRRDHILTTAKVFSGFA
jgi:hypothetical protein